MKEINKLMAKIVFCAILLASGVSSKRIHLTFQQAKVDFNPNYLQNHSIDICGNRDALNVVLNVLRDFTRDPWAEFSLSYRDPKSYSYRRLLAYNINICHILGKDSNNKLNFALMWVNNFMKYGNLPKSCPILKGNYFWDGLKVDQVSIPSFLLTGRYRANINTYVLKDDKKSRDFTANVTVDIQLK